VRKVGKENAISLAHRHAMCQLMCEETNWIQSIPWGWANAGRAGRKIKDFIKKKCGKEVNCMCVWGADLGGYFLNETFWDQRENIIISRPPYTAELEHIFEKLMKKKRPSRTKEDLFIYWDDGSNVRDVSSTRIRKFIQEKNGACLINENLCHPKVVEYLRQLFPGGWK